MTRNEVYSSYVEDIKSEHVHTNRRSGVYISAPSWNSEQDGLPDGDTVTVRGRFPHIKDLQERARVIIRNYGSHMLVSFARCRSA